MGEQREMRNVSNTVFKDYFRLLFEERLFIVILCNCARCLQALAEHEARAQQERKLRQAEERDVLEEKANADMADAERKHADQLESNKQQALREKEQKLAAIFESRKSDMTEEEQQHVRLSECDVYYPIFV